VRKGEARILSGERTGCAQQDLPPAFAESYCDAARGEPPWLRAANAQLDAERCRGASADGRRHDDGAVKKGQALEFILENRNERRLTSG
jgi:hypothetical protein